MYMEKDNQNRLLKKSKWNFSLLLLMPFYQRIQEHHRFVGTEHRSPANILYKAVESFVSSGVSFYH